MILKRNALDCYLFKEGNVIKKSDVSSMKLVDSKGKERIEQVYDKEYTKICSFQNTCDFKCINTDKKLLDKLDDNKLNYDTFNLDNFNDIGKKVLNYLNELFQKKKYYSLNDIIEHIQYYKNINKYIIYNSLKDIIDNKRDVYDINKNKGYIICRDNYYIFQPLFNNDESIPMFYRNNILNNKTSINIGELNINIPEQDSSESSSGEYDSSDILDELYDNYNNLINTNRKNVLNDFDLLKPNNKMFKRVYCEYLLDKLPFIERKKYIEFLLTDAKIIKDISDKNITRDEINKISYDYFSNNFIYKKNNKRVLFEFNDNIEGYYISNENIVSKIKTKKKENIVEEISKSIKYYKLTGKEFSEIDVVKTDFKLNTTKKWLHSYWSTKGEPVVKMVDEPDLGKILNPYYKDNTISSVIENVGKYSIFNESLKDIIKLKKIKDKELCMLTEIIFRLIDKLSKDIKYYISFDTLYFKLNK